LGVHCGSPSQFICTNSERHTIIPKQLALLANAPGTMAAPKVVVLEKATVARATKVVAFLLPCALGWPPQVGRMVGQHVCRRCLVAMIIAAARALVAVPLLAVGPPSVVPSHGGRVRPASAGRVTAAAVFPVGSSAGRVAGILVFRTPAARGRVAVAVSSALAPGRAAVAAAIADAAAAGRVSVFALAPRAARAAVRGRGWGAAGAMVGAPVPVVAGGAAAGARVPAVVPASTSASSSSSSASTSAATSHGAGRQLGLATAGV